MDRLIEVIVPVHDVSRPIERAVDSLLLDGVARAIVVCHGIDPDEIAARLDGPDRSVGTPRGGGPATDVLVAGFVDGIRSPAGPFNHGLDLARAPWVAVMGSDDFVEPGALSAWLAASTEQSGVVLAPLRHQNGSLIAAPLARPRRRTSLDFVRDRLAYRTAPLGLLRRSLVDERGLRFSADMQAGVDIEFGLRLWTSGIRVDYPRSAPAYVIGADAKTRVTHAKRSLTVELAPVEELLGCSWIEDLTEPARRAIAVKVVRIHVVAAIMRRGQHTDWVDGDIDTLRRILDRCDRLSRTWPRPLSMADRRLLAAARAGTVDDVVAAIAQRHDASRIDQIRTARWVDLFDREGILRRYLNYAVAR